MNRGRPKKTSKFNLSNLRQFSSSSEERIRTDESSEAGPSESHHALDGLEQMDIDQSPRRPFRAAAKRSRDSLTGLMEEELQERAQARREAKNRSKEQSRSRETPDEAEQRRQANRQHMQFIRANMSTQDKNRFREEMRDRMARLRQIRQQNPGRTYKAAMNISESEYKTLSSFNIKCQHCSALHFAEERTATNGDSFND